MVLHYGTRPSATYEAPATQASSEAVRLFSFLNDEGADYQVIVAVKHGEQQHRQSNVWGKRLCFFERCWMNFLTRSMVTVRVTFQTKKRNIGLERNKNWHITLRGANNPFKEILSMDVWKGITSSDVHHALRGEI